MRTLSHVAGLIWLGLLSPALADNGNPANQPGTISVEGEASADIAPDKAYLTLGVVAERATAGLAVTDMAKATQNMVDRLKAEAVDPKDIATGSITLDAVDQQDAAAKAKATAPKFRASTEMTITLSPPERAGILAAKLVDQGANTIAGIAYESSKESELRDRLRGEAVVDAKRKAESYVSALGLHLGRVVEISPNNGETFLVQPAPARKMSMRSDAMPPPPVPNIPVQPGLISPRTTVQVKWEIVP